MEREKNKRRQVQFNEAQLVRRQVYDRHTETQSFIADNIELRLRVDEL